MSLRTEVDLTRFKATLDRALLSTSRELSVAINARMFFLFKAAVDICKRANRQTILKLHGGGESRFFTSKGKLSKSTKARKGLTQDRGQIENAIANLIGRARKGRDAFAVKRFNESTSRVLLEKNARGWIAGKLKAVGFLASLFVLPLRRFDRFAEQKATKGGKERFTGKYNAVITIAKPARPGINPIGEAGFVVGGDSAGNALRPYAQMILNTAMQRAVNIETARMIKHLEEKTKQACRAAGMEVRG